MGSYQSGQMGQTVNLLAMPSVVRIHHYPLFPKITQRYKDSVFIMRIGFFIFILSTDNTKRKSDGFQQSIAFHISLPKD